MRVVLFCHSIVSDWNHGNAHFLRGVASELLARGHEVRIYEPRNAWSLENLVAEYGEEPIRRFHAAFPHLASVRYDPAALDLEEALDGAGLVLVHEWNEHGLVARIGCHRRGGGRYRLLFHDTHHRSVTDCAAMASYDLSGYDGVLAFGEVIREKYVAQGWAKRAWTWHEAADMRVCAPGLIGQPVSPVIREDRRNRLSQLDGDLVWIGNWGDDERTREIEEFLLKPVRDLRLTARVHGVRYPQSALRALAEAGLEYAGWAPNYEVPSVFSGFRATVHIPRGPYVRSLPGIPTIRVFEALACGIPLLSAPWTDSENLFTPGRDFLFARSGEEMKSHLRALRNDAAMSRELARRGRETVLARHTCAHRVDQLLEICQCLSN
ncbi:MAG: glycosyltransferase [Acidobacteriia bacterium]|nr:glycosyltransferase [Terriglobia bacterium]